MTLFLLGVLTVAIPATGGLFLAYAYGCRVTEDSYTARAQGDPAASLARDTWTGALDTWEPAKPGDTPGELTPQLHPLVEVALPWHSHVSWVQPKPQRDRLATIRRWISDPLRVGALVDAGLTTRTPKGAEPASEQVRVGVTGRSLAPRTSGNAAPPHAQPSPQAGAPAGSLLQLLDDEPDREKYPHWPWTVLPLEPGLGEHDEQEPEHEAIVEPVRTVLLVEAPRGPRHAKPDPLTDSDVRAIWPELVALLNTAGVDVDPLALPCTHCTDDEHGDCPGCACGCKLSEVTG